MVDRDTTKRMFTHMINIMEQHDTMTISCSDPLIELLKDVRELLKEHEVKPLRCKECSYHRNDGWCNEHRREVKESDYCSFGAWEGR